eukprot:2367007-Prymnesium_polylepis.4
MSPKANSGTRKRQPAGGPLISVTELRGVTRQRSNGNSAVKVLSNDSRSWCKSQPRSASRSCSPPASPQLTRTIAFRRRLPTTSPVHLTWPWNLISTS